MTSNVSSFQAHIAEIDGLLQVLPDLPESEANDLKTLIGDKIGSLPQVRAQDRSLPQAKALEGLVALRKTLIWRSFDVVHINSIIAQEIRGWPTQKSEKAQKLQKKVAFESEEIRQPRTLENSTFFSLQSIMMPTGHSLTVTSNLGHIFLSLDAPHNVFVIVDAEKQYKNEWSPFTFQKTHIQCIVYSDTRFCLVPDVDDVNDKFKVNPILVEMTSQEAAQDLLHAMEQSECECVGVETATLEEMWVQAWEGYAAADKREEKSIKESNASRLKALEQ